MGASILTDLQALPLITVTFTGEPVSDADLREFVAGQRELLSRGTRLFSVTDATHAKALPASQRKILADWLQESEEATKSLVMGMAIVVSNPLVRGALTAVFWLRKPAVPTRLFATLPEALEHAMACLREEGFEITPRMRDLAAEARRTAAPGR